MSYIDSIRDKIAKISKILDGSQLSEAFIILGSMMGILMSDAKIDNRFKEGLIEMAVKDVAGLVNRDYTKYKEEGILKRYAEELSKKSGEGGNA